MKFGKRIQALMVPEWRTKYVDYKGMKRAIKHVKRVREHILENRDVEMGLLLHSGDERNPSNDYQQRQSNDQNSEAHQVNHNQQQQQQQQHHHNNNINNHNEHHHHHHIQPIQPDEKKDDTEEEEEEEQQPDQKVDNNVNSNNNDIAKAKEGEEAPSAATIAENEDEKGDITPTFYLPQYERLRQWARRRFSPISSAFSHLLLSELEKVSEFYERTERRYAARQGQIHQQIYVYRKMRAKKGKKGISKKRLHLLRKVFQEHYRSLNLLMNYRVLNYTAFVKSVKKYQKNMDDSQLGIMYEFMDLLKQQYFYSSPILKALIAQIEYMFTQDIFQGDRKKAMTQLREQEKTKRETRNETFRTGVSAGVALVLTIFAIYYYFVEFPGYRFKAPQPEYTSSSFFYYRLILLPIIMGLLFALDIKIWNHARINYVFIFQFNPRDHLYPAQIAEIFFWLYNISLISLIAFMWTVVMELRDIINFHGYAYLHPIILAGLIGIWWLLPVRRFHGKARYWLLHTLGRVAIAPFCQVKFKDFFIADQLTSLSNVLFEIQFAVCVYPVLNSSGGGKFCDKYQGLGVPILNLIPSWARFAQCLRRLRDSKWKQWNPHAINAGKYFTSITVAIISFVDRAVYPPLTHGHTWNALKIVWVVVASISMIYSLGWDLMKDWGLLHRKHRFLRTELLFPRYVYYVCMATNSFMRMFWIAPALLQYYLPDLMNEKWMSFLFILVELIRRCQWNVFRLENEHLNNCGEYRAVIDVPLPFEVEQQAAELEEDSDKESRKQGLKAKMNRFIKFVSCKKLKFKDVFFCLDNNDDDTDKDHVDVEEEEHSDRITKVDKYHHRDIDHKVGRSHARRESHMIDHAIAYDMGTSPEDTRDDHTLVEEHDAEEDFAHEAEHHHRVSKMSPDQKPFGDGTVQQQQPKPQRSSIVVELNKDSQSAP